MFPRVPCPRVLATLAVAVIVTPPGIVSASALAACPPTALGTVEVTVSELAGRRGKREVQARRLITRCQVDKRADGQ